jgi:hypothetical protein
MDASRMRRCLLAAAMSLPLLGSASWARTSHLEPDADTEVLGTARSIDPPSLTESPAQARAEPPAQRPEDPRASSADAGGAIFDPFATARRAAPAPSTQPHGSNAPATLILAALAACAMAYLLRKIRGD